MTKQNDAHPAKTDHPGYLPSLQSAWRKLPTERTAKTDQTGRMLDESSLVAVILLVLSWGGSCLLWWIGWLSFSCLLGFSLCCFVPDSVLGIRVPFLFAVLSMMWNLIVSLPDLCPSSFHADWMGEWKLVQMVQVIRPRWPPHPYMTKIFISKPQVVNLGTSWKKCLFQGHIW